MNVLPKGCRLDSYYHLIFISVWIALNCICKYISDKDSKRQHLMTLVL